MTNFTRLQTITVPRALLLACVGLTSAGQSSDAAAAAPKGKPLRNLLKDECLTIKGGQAAVAKCDGSAAQRWRKVAVPTGGILWKNDKSQCLAAPHKVPTKVEAKTVLPAIAGSCNSSAGLKTDISRAVAGSEIQARAQTQLCLTRAGKSGGVAFARCGMGFASEWRHGDDDKKPGNCDSIEDKGTGSGTDDHLVLNTDVQWPVGSEITVCYHNDKLPSKAVRKEIEKYSKRWTQYANLSFRFKTKGPCNIVIGFDKDDGNWSKLGKREPGTEKTMNLGSVKGYVEDDNEDGLSRKILHEFGHAIGFQHEHLSPKAKIDWNEQAVIDYYGNKDNPWPEEKVRFNYFDALDVDTHKASKFDEHSVMLYSVPEKWVNGGWDDWEALTGAKLYQGGSELSKLDKKYAAKWYPYPNTSYHLDAAVAWLDDDVWEDIVDFFEDNDAYAYFFGRDDYVRYNLSEGEASANYPRDTSKAWSSWTLDDDIDAAYNNAEGKVYVFKGDKYARIDVGKKTQDKGYPKKISSGFKGMPFKSDIDAAYCNGDGKTYFFKGDQYVRWDIEKRKVDKGYPKKISSGYKKMGFTRDLDAAFNKGNGKVYFFKHDSYVRWDIDDRRPDKNYPKKVKDGWEGVRFN